METELMTAATWHSIAISLIFVLGDETLHEAISLHLCTSQVSSPAQLSPPPPLQDTLLVLDLIERGF